MEYRVEDEDSLDFEGIKYPDREVDWTQLLVRDNWDRWLNMALTLVAAVLYLLFLTFAVIGVYEVFWG